MQNKRPFHALLIIILISAFSSVVWAQSEPGDGEGVNSQILWFTPGPSHFVSIQSSDVLGNKAVSFGAVADYHRRSLGLRVNNKVHWSVKRVSSVNFSWAMGILDIFQVGLVLPVILEQYGKGAAPLIVDEDEAHKYYLASSAVGDLRLHAKTRLLGNNEDNPDQRGIGIALDVALSMPSGDELNFAGENGIVFAPGMIFDFHSNPFSVGLNLGVRIRSGEKASLADASVGNQLSSGVGVTVHLLDELLLLSIESNLLAELDEFNRMGIEFRGALGTRPGESKSVTLWLSGSGGMSNQDDPLLGVPQMRFTLGLSYAPGAVDDDDFGF